MQKAEQSGADCLILDLEDSVATSAKAQARSNVSEALQRGGAVSLFVRVGHPEAGSIEDDVNALTGSRVQGIVLPKVERLSEIELVSALLTKAEARLGIPNGSLTIIPMIESCLGVRNTFDIVRASSRVRGIAIASAEEGDLMLDIGGRWTPQGEAMSYARSHVVCEARAAGLEWLIDGVFMKLTDDAALRTECILARNVGYRGKLAIHPKQLSTFHEIFSPTLSELEYAKGLIAAFSDAERLGQGATRYKGMMVDYANVKLAKKTLEMAGLAVPGAGD